EACVRAVDIAIRFRQEFGQDIVINMICYRRHGHNEGDEPAFTQPLMYQTIKAHPTLREIYGKKLMKENVVDQALVDRLLQERMDHLQELVDRTRKNPPTIKPLAFDGLWKGLRRGVRADFETTWPTGAKKEDVKAVGELLTSIPKTFNPLPKLRKIVDDRK